MIRPTEAADTNTILTLAQQTGVFKPHEIEALDEVLSDYHATNKRLGHHAVTYEEAGRIVGFAYWAPAGLTDRTWYLYWIAVSRHAQGRGVGHTLLDYAENEIRAQRGRLLLIETSSLPHYDTARKFYLNHHYEQAAVIPDFYSDGDDIVVYRKRLS